MCAFVIDSYKGCTLSSNTELLTHLSAWSSDVCHSEAFCLSDKECTRLCSVEASQDIQDVQARIKIDRDVRPRGVMKASKH